MEKTTKRVSSFFALFVKYYPEDPIQGIWHAWEKIWIHTRFWLENLKERVYKTCVKMRS